jgi:hypothetical protein
LAKIRDIYPDFYGESTTEKSIPEAEDQKALEQVNDVPEKTTVSKKTSLGIVGAFVLLIAVMLLLQFA